MKPFVPGNVACAGSDSGTARNAETIRNTGSSRAARIASPPSWILETIQQVGRTRSQRFRMRIGPAKDGQNEQEERRSLRMPGKRAGVKNERQYEGLRKKGMSKERAAR